MKISINRNFLWSDVFVKQLEKCGLKNICISPGSRNTSLTIAFSKSKRIIKHVIVDERSSAFFALGIAKVTKQPTALLTTSGTAVANLYPAIIEAYNSRVPLIILTADRPEYLLNTGANQTINQIDIFKNHIRKYFNPGLPNNSLEAVNNLKRIASNSFQTSVHNDIGPVQINLPFEKPFEPSIKNESIDEKLFKKFYSFNSYELKSNNFKISKRLTNKINNCEKGLIILGGKDYNKSFFTKLISLSNKIKFPILAEGNSSIRFIKRSADLVIENHTTFLRSDRIRKYFDPDILIHFGNAPTSNILLDFIEQSQAYKIYINENGDLKDPSRTSNKLIKANEENFISELLNNAKNKSENTFTKNILMTNKITESSKKEFFKGSIKIEPFLIKKIAELLPQKANLFLSNSMPIRDFDFFSSKSKKDLRIFTNRGASGIDGIISTAAGVASQSKNPTYLIIGDLAFHHDSNGLQILTKYNIPLKIILINNSGGRIFNSLPIASEKIDFDQYFRTELDIDFKAIVKAHKGNYVSVKSENSLKNFITSNKSKFSVAEIITDTDNSLRFRKDFWKKAIVKCEKYLFQ